MGGAVIDTDEPGALVEVDGRTVGFTPSVLTLPVGPHRVRVSAAGYRPSETELLVEKDTQVRLRLTLRDRDEVVAATRAAQSIDDAPSSVTLISQQEIAALAYPTLSEALRTVRGFYVWDDRSYVTIAARGMGRLDSYGNRILVLFDGSNLNDDWLGSSYVGFDGTTDLDDYERLEVVRGPGSVVYGTSAMSGVINLVPRRPTRSGGSLRVATALDGVARGTARLDQVWSSNAGLWMTVAAARSEGRDYYFPEYVQETQGSPTPGWSRGADGFHSSGLRGEAWWRFLSLRWWWNDHDKRLPAGSFESLLGDPRSHQRDRRGLLEARATPKLGEHTELLSRAHLNHYDYRSAYARPSGDPWYGVEEDTYDSWWLGLENRLQWTPSPRWQLAGGVEGQLHFDVETTASDESGTWLDLTGKHATPFRVGAAYASVDHEAAAWARLSLGARLDSYSSFGSSLSPRAAAIFRPYEGGNLKLMAGRAFRAPSTYELNYLYNGVSPQGGSTRLRPETIYSAEAEFTHRFSTTWSATAATFINQFRSPIDNVGSGSLTDPLRYANLGESMATAGLELALGRSWRQGWMLHASYGYTVARFLEDSRWSTLMAFRQSPDYRHVANAPQHLAALKGVAPLLDRHLQLGSRLSLEGARWDRNELVVDAPQRHTQTAVLWDLVLSGRQDKLHVSYAFGAYNLFDWRYEQPVGSELRSTTMPQLGRSVLASLGVEL